MERARELVIPFKPFNSKTNVPEWWEKYNGLKHDLGSNIKDANLKYTRDALASGFLLNVIHEPAVLRLYDYGVLNPLIPTSEKRKKGWDMFLSRNVLEEYLNKKSKFSAQTETPLFIYDYDH